MAKPWRVITDQDPTYPATLVACSDHPRQLFVWGKWPQLWPNLAVAVIGTRKPTVYGQTATHLLVRQLVAEQALIVSGAMIGIDSYSHQQAIAAGGSTIGVLGYGFEHCYPRSQAGLLQEIVASGGCLVSEYPPETPPLKHQFVRRNRIIAGLSRAVVVVEAAIKSGTMTTVEFALEYGRLVAAVPGPITSLYSQGTASLLKQGAVCVTKGSDIVTELGGELGYFADDKNSPKSIINNEKEHKIWTILSAGPQTLDTIVAHTQTDAAEVLTLLSTWEMAGWVKTEYGVWAQAR